MPRRTAKALFWTALMAGAAIVHTEPTAFPSPSPTPRASPPQTAAGAEPDPSPTPPADCSVHILDEAERDTLLRLAWRTLNGHLTHQPIRDADLEGFSLTPCLLAPRGLFITIKKGDLIRGRQGELEPTRPLYQPVIVFTRRAATRDPRFPPLTSDDLGGLTLELSVIGSRRTIAGPAEIHLDRDGVALEKWGRRAFFLPGFASQKGWTAERTLDELCAQAALPKGSWSESAKIEVFMAEGMVGGPPPAPSPTASPAPLTPEAAPTPGG